MEDFKKFRRKWYWIGVPVFGIAVLLALYVREWQRAIAWFIALAGYHSAYMAWGLLHEIQDSTRVLTTKEWDAYQELVKLIHTITRGKKHVEQDKDEVLH